MQAAFTLTPGVTRRRLAASKSPVSHASCSGVTPVSASATASLDVVQPIICEMHHNNQIYYRMKAL